MFDDDDDDFELPDELGAIADAAGAALANMGEEFAAEAQIEANRLNNYLKQAQNATNDENFMQGVSAAFDIAHNLKGQGATFGYNLVTELSEYLCKIMRPKNNPDREGLPVMLSCAKALYDLLANRIEGDGGAVGARMRDEFGIN